MGESRRYVPIRASESISSFGKVRRWREGYPRTVQLFFWRITMLRQDETIESFLSLEAVALLCRSHHADCSRHLVQGGFHLARFCQAY